MKRWAIIAISLLICGIGLLVASPSRDAAAQAEAGWITLFNGQSLEDWSPIGTANWKLEDGVLVADNGNGFMVSKTSYGDFQLRVEFWVEDKTNSGVFIRCTDPNSVSGKTSYEVNIWDTRPDPKYGTGAIVDVAAVDPMPKAGGRWNVYEITAKGDTFTVIFNGQKTVDGAKSDKFASGRIALQHGKGVTDESGVVKFRKVEIKPL
jgi:3-keto-disaccharide hydrolase